jgi:RimJ/RimL family protein N-acetyltransferase
MLRGEYVVLRTPGISDVDIISAWQNDREVTKLIPSNPFPVSKKTLEDYISKIAHKKDCIILIIENEDEIPIGISALDNIDWVNGTAEINITIYAKNCWGRGYGFDTLKTLTEYGLYQINLHTIYANIIEKNERALKCFEKAGYEIEGKLYHRLFKEGKYENYLSVSIFKGRDQEG